jgi:hypothetical protein
MYSHAVRARVIIMVTTFRRPGGLARLLASLARLDVPEGVDISALVIDNDPPGEDAPSEPVRAACEAARSSELDVTVFAEPSRGLSQARNRAIAEALRMLAGNGRVADAGSTGPGASFLAFLDDDEIASARWLAELLRIAREHDADAVAGPVVPVFESPLPAHIEATGLLRRGSSPTGTLRRWAFTGNVLMRAESLRTFMDTDPRGGGFDPRLARVGSEDRHFFQRWTAAGLSIVWCAEAIVEETAPIERTTEAFIVERKARIARASSWIERDLRAGPLTDAKQIAKGLVWIAIGLAGGAVGLFAGRAARLRARVHRAWGLGVLAGVRGDLREGY